MRAFGGRRRIMPRSKRLVLSAFALALLAGVLTFCEKAKTPPFECKDSLGCVSLSPDEPLKIGVLQALSGKVAALGREQIRGIELGLDKRQGKLLGHNILLQMEDTGCTPEGGANAALKLIADPQTVAILGTTCSSSAAMASKAMSEAGLTMISGNNSAPFLTSKSGKRAPNWQPGYFRTAFNEESSGKTAALYAFKQLGVRKAATINDGDIYSRGLTDGFRQAFEELGGKIVLHTSVNKGEKEMGPVLTAVTYSDAQMIFFPLFQPEGNRLLLQAREKSEFKDTVLMSDGALIENSFIQSVGEKGTGMYFVGPARPSGPAVDAVARQYESRFDGPPAASYYLFAYDAATLLFDTIEKIAVQDPDGSLHIGRQALRDGLYATKGFKGVTGTLNCDEFGDCASPAFNVLRLKDPAAGIEGLQSNVMFTYAAPRKIK